MSAVDSRPRSTPMPGVETFIPTGDPITGNADSGRPPRPSEFVEAAAGFSAPASPPGARAPLPGMHHPELEDFTFVPPTRRRRRSGRGWGWLLMVIIYGAGPVAGISAGVWAFFKAREAMSEASDLSNPALSDRDREALGLPDTVETLFQADRRSSGLARAGRGRVGHAHHDRELDLPAGPPRRRADLRHRRPRERLRRDGADGRDPRGALTGAAAGDRCRRRARRRRIRACRGSMRSGWLCCDRSRRRRRP